MKILYAIQGTGNGHLSRARDIYPELCKYGTVDVLVSGIQADLKLPFPIKYECYGMSFIFGKKGGVDIWKTARSLKLPLLIKDIRRLPVESYDLVINDFEPISAWACNRKKIPCISLSHQAAVLHPAAPKPKKTDLKGKIILNKYAPVTDTFGFHFKSYGAGISTPVIRKEVREKIPVNGEHFTVYLPAYSDKKIIGILSGIPVKWEVFSKHSKKTYQEGNISIAPVSNESFLSSIASARGVLCGAGFEGPAEALFLGKQLLAIPMAGQYEQQCNAAALADMGVPILPSLHQKYRTSLQQWVADSKIIKVDFPDNAAEVVQQLMSKYAV